MQRKPHSGRPLGRRLPWTYCQNCGLVLLKNRVSEQAWWRESCPGKVFIRVEQLKR